jgi:hypothetical protein
MEHHHCLRLIAPEEVVQAVVHLLGEKVKQKKKTFL